MLGADIFTKENREKKWKPVVDGALARIESGVESTDQDLFHDLNILQMDFFQRVNYQDFFFEVQHIPIDDGHLGFLRTLYNTFRRGAKAGDPKAAEVITDMRADMMRLMCNRGGAA